MSSPIVTIGVNPEAIREARKAILEIIETSNADATKQAALHTLEVICDVNNTTIKDCVFKSEAPIENYAGHESVYNNPMESDDDD